MTLKLLKEYKCEDWLITHSICVLKKSLEISSAINTPTNIDLELLATGALLHDIGKSQTNSIDHGIIGAEILRNNGYSEKVAKIAERHIGGGIPKNEALNLGLPEIDFIPETIEEKIVAHSDNLFHGYKEVNIEFTINKLLNKFDENHSSIKRVRDLDNEIKNLINGK
ncbi:MAG: TIGR00295 family protein [Methanobacteriaceae archaeon]